MPARLAIAAVALALCTGIAPSRAADDPALATTQELVRLEKDRHDRMTVPVTIGAHGPYDFLIDTGSERTVLSRQIATAMGLAISGNAMIVGVAGSIPVELVDVDELTFGRKTYYGINAPLLEDEHIGADGIVGLDSLQQQRVVFDFAKNHMYVDESPKRASLKGFSIVVQARRRSGQLIMTNASVDGVPTDIVIDTGSDGSIGNLALQKALSRSHNPKTTSLYSVTGQIVSADLGFARMVDIDGMRLHNTVLAYADAPAFHRLGLVKRPALLMGMTQLRMFRRVAIDFAARRVLFDVPINIAGLNNGGRPF
ncbi:MAG: retropepsin-like aspartic protease [Novosphingobium sp.]